VFALPPPPLLLLLQFLGIDGYAEQYDKSNKVEHSWYPR
jgi:hypothetical protein